MINYRPILTTIGEQVIANAIANGTDIILESIALGDAGVDLEYNVTHDMTELKNELARIKVRTVTMDVHMFYGEAVARIFGYVAPNSAIDMTIREVGLYDTLGNLIMVTRTSEIETKTAGPLRTGVKIKINKKIPVAAAELFRVEASENNDAILETELAEHINQSLNVHRTTKEQVGLGNVLDISDENLPVSQLMVDMISDTKMATGFIDRNTNRLFNANNMLTLIIDSPTGVYKNGALYTLTENATINLGYQPEWEEVDGEGNPTGVIHPAIPAASGEFFIGLNVDTNELYIDNNPNVETDILVAFVVCNEAQGIISINDERHTASKNLDWYKTQELMNKISWLSGGELTLAEDNDTNVNLSISSPVMMANKDIHYRITHSETPTADYAQDLTNMYPPVLYINNSNEIVFAQGNGIPWLNNGSWAVYNNRASGLLSEIPNGKYINYLIVYTADVVAPIKMIVGDKTYDTELAASSEDISVFSYILDRIRCKVAYKVVIHVDSAYINNIGKMRVAKIENLASNTSLRNSMTPKNHNELGDSRFEDDQHSIENIEGLAEAVAGVGQIKSARAIGNITGDGELIDDTVVIDNKQADTSLWGESNNTVVFTNLIGSVYSSGGWVGAVLAPTGKIYCAPNNATQILEVDPTTKATALVGSVYNGTNKYYFGALAPNGKIYFAQVNTPQILEFDPTTKTTILVGTAYDTGVSINRWLGIALAPNGNMYLSPYDKQQVLEFNPTTKTTTLIGINLGSDLGKYASIALAPNGKLYCPPYTGATRVLKVDPLSKVTSLVGNVYNGAGKWYGAALAPNGKIYCAPANSTQVLEIDPKTDATRLVGPSFGAEIAKWIGITLAPNGKLYCIPYRETRLLEIDTSNKDNIVFNLLSVNHAGGDKYYAAALAPNGKIYSPPWAATQVLEIDVFPKTTDYGSYLFSGQLKI